MKNLTSLCLLLVLLVGSLARTHAQPFRTDINPALLYYQAFLLGPNSPQEDRHYLFESQDWVRGEKLPERFGELVSSYGKQLRYAYQASQCTVACDWGIDLTPGPDTLLPHLAKGKGIAQAGRLHAMWALQQGDQSQARKDLTASFALGRNTSRDGTLIAVLVQIAIENIVCSTVAENYFQLTPETLTQLSEAFAVAPPRGTVASCFKTETAFVHWFQRKVDKLRKENPGDDSKVLAGLEEIFRFWEPETEGDSNSSGPTVWQRLLKAAGGTSDGILKLTQELQPYYDRLAAVMALPQPEYEVKKKELFAEIMAAKNPLVSISLTPFGKSRDKEFTALAQLAMVQAAIQYKLRGEAGLKSVPDPFGTGPFAFERFVFEDTDRGFKLQTAYPGKPAPIVMIFVEKDGPAFNVTGPKAGLAIRKAPAGK